ncbi:hypothetical protein NH340_JMT07381 [Sarcoptes scabiei]|nr:hypothetical protein NH340_JMT07381 [Sarcoptes scabiei]
MASSTLTPSSTSLLTSLTKYSKTSRSSPNLKSQNNLNKNNDHNNSKSVSGSNGFDSRAATTTSSSAIFKSNSNNNIESIQSLSSSSPSSSSSSTSRMNRHQTEEINEDSIYSIQLKRITYTQNHQNLPNSTDNDRQCNINQNYHQHHATINLSWNRKKHPSCRNEELVTRCDQVDRSTLHYSNGGEDNSIEDQQYLQWETRQLRTIKAANFEHLVQYILLLTDHQQQSLRNRKKKPKSKKTIRPNSSSHSIRLKYGNRSEDLNHHRNRLRTHRDERNIRKKGQNNFQDGQGDGNDNDGDYNNYDENDGDGDSSFDDNIEKNVNSENDDYDDEDEDNGFDLESNHLMEERNNVAHSMHVLFATYRQFCYPWQLFREICKQKPFANPKQFNFILFYWLNNYPEDFWTVCGPTSNTTPPASTLSPSPSSLSSSPSSTKTSTSAPLLDTSIESDFLADQQSPIDSFHCQDNESLYSEYSGSSFSSGSQTYPSFTSISSNQLSSQQSPVMDSITSSSLSTSSSQSSTSSISIQTSLASSASATIAASQSQSRFLPTNLADQLISMRNIDEEVKKHCLHLLDMKRDHSQQQHPPQHPNQSIYKTINKSLSINELDAKFIAQQLTVIDLENFLTLKPYNLLATIRTKTKIEIMIRNFNLLSRHVVITILQHQTPHVVTNHWIEVAQHLRKMRNFNSLKAIIAGLTNESIYRLRNVIWAKLSRTTLSTFQNLSSIVDDVNNQTMLRHTQLFVEGTSKVSNEESFGTVPYLGTFLTDITMINTRHKNYIKLESGQKLINFEKCNKQYEILMQIQLLQKNAIAALQQHQNSHHHHQQLNVEPIYSLNHYLSLRSQLVPTIPRVARIFRQWFQMNESDLPNDRDW